MTFTPETIQELKAAGFLNEDAAATEAPAETEPVEAASEAAATEPVEPQTVDAEKDEPLGEAGLKALRAEREARTKFEAEAKAASGLKGQLTKAANSLSEVTSERDSLASELARFKVALTHGLSAEDMDVLPSGLSEDALERIAVRLSNANSPKRPAPDANQGKSGETKLTPQQEFAAFLDSNFS